MPERRADAADRSSDAPGRADGRGPDRLRVAILAVVVLAAAGVAAWWLVGRDAGSAPAAPEVPPATAPEASAGGPGAGGSEAAGGAVPVEGEVTELAGVWTVDTGVPLDLAAGTGSYVGYLVDEELSTIGAFTANGRTGDVSGSVTVEGTTVTTASFTAPLDGLTSDSSLRDGRVRSLLGGLTVGFELAEPFEADRVPAPGEVVRVVVPGTLTIGDASRAVEAELEVSVEGPRLLVRGTVDLLLSDLGIEAPRAPIVLSVSDAASIEVQLYLVRT
ncbi:MAG: hypothetical protein RLZZ272_623 [Actinomycetota bacterium]